MSKAYFNSEMFRFLRELKRNNRRPWFLKNKHRYEALIRQPCFAFIADFQFRLREISPWMKADPKPNGGSLKRIYRDIRFSSDKTPYKTNVGLHFPHGGSKDHVHGASFYIHFEPGASFLAGGCWHPDNRSLARIRDAVAWKAKEWKAAVRGLELSGDSLTRPPRGYPADHPMIEDLKRKDFVAYIELSDSLVCSPRLMGEIVRGGKKLSPLMEFLCQAMGLRF
jgi:uncharacterized protein (TIGR02453 family)